jgi:hypothetical protein
MDFVLEIPNHIHKEVCEDMIKRFENDTRKHQGVLGPPPRVETSIKSSMDLSFSSFEEWKDVDTYILNKINEGVDLYKKHLSKKGIDAMYNAFNNCHDSGYQIKKTTKGEYYAWHNDSVSKDGRFLVFIFYLNTLHPIYDGGGTAFHPTSGCGKVITPEEGKLLIFPATWTYFHTGLPITSDKSKYICTTWLCSKTS